MEMKRYGWEAQARRTILSEERELATLPGFRIRARKYSIAAQDEIRAEQLRKKDSLPVEMRALIARAGAKGRTVGDMVASLGEAEAAELLGKLSAESTSVEALMRLSLLHGLGEHNLEDQDRVTTGATRELVDRLMEYPATASEIHGIIEEWNAPLRKATPRTSGTSPSGSISGQSSTGETPSPTAETPRD